MSKEVIVEEGDINTRLSESLELAIEDSIKTVLDVEDVDVSIDLDMSPEDEDAKLTGTFIANWSDDQEAEVVEEVESDEEE